MKTLFQVFFALLLALGISGCFAEKTYVGKVDIVAIGAGPKPASVENQQYVEASKLPDVVVAYTPTLKVTEQKASDTVKYVAGDALIKTYSGEPKLLADYLNYKQDPQNAVVILDKNGVVAWSGAFRSAVNGAQGVYDYGLTGVDRMNFEEAMEKFVLDGETTDYDADKKIEFPHGNKESFLAGFSYSKKHPLLFTKLPDMKLQTADGKTIKLSQYANNGKPTVIMLFLASKSADTLANDLNKAKDIASMFLGGSGSDKELSPEAALREIEQTYFKKH